MFALPVYDSLICFGDSLTQQGSQIGGFVASLQNVYLRRLDVINRGFGGYTSRQAVALCPTLFSPGSSSQSTSCKLIIVWLGTNDSIDASHDQHVPIDEFESNMITILRHFTSTDILLITPGSVVPGIFPGHMDDKSMREYGQRLNKVAAKVSRERIAATEGGKIAILDMNASFVAAAQEIEGGMANLFIDDGLHINEAGYKVVFKAIKDAIFAEYPHLHPDKLPYIFPNWRSLTLSADQQGQRQQLQPKPQL